MRTGAFSDTCKVQPTADAKPTAHGGATKKGGSSTSSTLTDRRVALRTERKAALWTTRVRLYDVVASKSRRVASVTRPLVTPTAKAPPVLPAATENM